MIVTVIAAVGRWDVVLVDEDNDLLMIVIMEQLTYEKQKALDFLLRSGLAFDPLKFFALGYFNIIIKQINMIRAVHREHITHLRVCRLEGQSPNLFE